MILPGLFIKETTGKGRGVFTSEPVSNGEVVEVSPVVVMTAADRVLLDKTLLHDYIFEWGESKEQCCMALGYIAVYNHSYQSNCEYFMDFETDSIMIKAVRDIEPGEELTINYNGNWDDETKVWFETT